MLTVHAWQDSEKPVLTSENVRSWGPSHCGKIESDPSLDSNPKTPIVLPLPSEEELNTFYNNLSKAGKALPYYLLFRALVMIMYKITVIIPTHCHFCMIPVVWQ